MADAYVNFYAALDPGGYLRGAQAFQGRASQPHRAGAAVGANVAAATAIALEAATEYVQIKPTSGDVFACILPNGASDAEKTAARERFDQGDREVLCKALGVPATLYIWAA